MQIQSLSLSVTSDVGQPPDVSPRRHIVHYSTAAIYIIIIIIATAITANHLAIVHLVTLVLAERAGTYPFSGRVSLRRDDSLNATQIHMFTIHLLQRRNNMYSIIIIHPIR